MIKTRAWPVRAMYMLVAFALVISLLIAALPPQTVAAASPLISRWDRVSTPSHDNWLLAPESTIIDYAVADQGKVAYAVVERWNWDGYGLADDSWGIHLLKSTDHAATWRDITKGLKKEIDRKDLGGICDIYKVATAPDDPDFVAVALCADIAPLQVRVFISEDGGAIFRDTGAVADAWDQLLLVYDLAVSAADKDDWHDIAIGGEGTRGRHIWRSRATGHLATGWEDATTYPGWDDRDPSTMTTGFDSAAVVAIQFAPSWYDDKTVLVATVAGWETWNSSVHLQSGTWGTDVVEAWNKEAGFTSAALIVEGVRVSRLEDWGGLGGFEAGITLPTDYAGRFSTRRFAWVWVNYWVDAANPKPVGEIYVVNNGNAQAVREQVMNRPWLTNVSYWGTIAEGKAIAGLLGTGDPREDLYTDPCQGVQVYHYDKVGPNMDICCPAWKPACKAPTGSRAMEAFYITAEKAYAVALLDYQAFGEGAWSFSFDDGYNWNQLSLIDTWISYLSDVAVSPNCNKTMAVSVNYGPDFDTNADNFCDSVWYRAENQTHAPEYSGKWLRTWSGKLTGKHPLCELKWGLLRLAPEETDGETVYLVDLGSNKLYYNGMQTLDCWEEGRATVDMIVDLAVKDESTVYALGLDGNVAMSDDYGVAPSWSKPVDTEIDAGWSIAVHGEEILVGGQYQNWNYSTDGGKTWFDDTERGSYGLVTLAFDSYYDVNSMIYAAVGLGGDHNGIYRYVMGESAEWKDIHSEEWTDLRARSYDYTGLVVDNADGNPMTSSSTGGVLYASYVTDWWADTFPPNFGGAATGVARLLTPALDFCCDQTEWDYLEVSRHPGIFARSLFAMAPRALKICGCLTPDSNSKLFAIGFYVTGTATPFNMYDMGKADWGTVWTWEDCFAKSAPNLRSPADGTRLPDAGCCQMLAFLMEWSRLCDACDYEIEIALDSSFTKGVERFPQQGGDPVRPTPCTAPSWMFRMTAFLNPGTTYYWRIRSIAAETEQVVRSWWSTPLRFTTGLLSDSGVKLMSPEAGATDVPRTNIAFVWDSIAPADSYNWVLSPNADLSGAVGQQTVTNPSYKFTGTLSADTSYYWSVTAIRNGSAISMAIGSFTTAATKVYCSPQSGLCFSTEAELKAHHEQLHKDAMRTPAWVWVIIAIGAVLVIVVIVLIFRTRRV